MAKGKSTWKYNKLLTARRNYFVDGGQAGFLGLDWSNPFKGTNGAAATNALTSAAGAAVGGIGGGLLSGDMTSGAGSLLQGLSGVASAIPGPWGAVASAGLGLVGGLTNRLFGSKMNTENIAEVEANINSLNNFQSNASNFDTLSQNWANANVGMTFDDSFIGKDGWLSNKAKNKAADLRSQVEAGNTRVQNTLTNNAKNIGTTQMQNLLSNYAALGGPMDFGGGAINYDFMNRYITAKEEASQRKSSMGSLPNSFTGGIPYALGGNLMTHGADWTNGLTAIENGGSHESNPFEGVPMGVDEEGTPNLVEEGETIFNNYVFSKRLMVPKAVREKYKLRGTKELSFADASKQLAKESEERPNDPISERGMQALMADLAIAQEGVRRKQQAEQFAHGGKLFDKGGPKYADWLRYAPAVAYGIGTLTDALGITNKPDYTNADAILAATKSGGTYQPVKFNPIGNYLTYRPFDRDFYINKMNAEAGATRRSLLNTSGGNRATAMAGILAADNNYLNQIGSLARQAEEYNLAQRQQVEDFNRSTNTTNSQGRLQADIANQQAQASARDFSLRGIVTAAQMKEAARAATDQNKSTNISGLFQTLGDIGYEEKNARMRDQLIEHGWVPGAEDFGRFKTKTTPDKARSKSEERGTDIYDVVPGEILYDVPVIAAPMIAAKGGKLKRVKRKRGLTL